MTTTPEASNHMDLMKAGTLVCEAGLRLLREGMVARTWGNISVRVNQDLFVVTPSGIPYDRMTPEKIVSVNLTDMSWSGGLKPSSEKDLHGFIYRERPEINAVIHTHQSAGSAVSAARRSIDRIEGKARDIIGPHVHTAAYALPGTGKLARVAAAAIRGSKAVLLANHGAVCIGTDMEDAFNVCFALESLCENLVLEQVRLISGEYTQESGLIHRVYLEKFGI